MDNAVNLWNCSLHLDPNAAVRPGTLARICGVFADRDISIESISAGNSTSEAWVLLTFTTTPLIAEEIRSSLMSFSNARRVNIAAAG
ncbi:MAG: ACT domain-containing protein [Planctomycetota bacterium]